MNSFIKKADENNNDPNIALLQYRNSPIDGLNLSPAQMLMNRILRSKLLIKRTWLEQKPNKSQKSKLKVRQMKQKYFHDRKCTTLPRVGEKEIIRIQYRDDRTWGPAVIHENLRYRTYTVLDQQGKKFRRNRSQILTSRETRFQISAHDIDTENSNTMFRYSADSSYSLKENIPNTYPESPVTQNCTVTRSVTKTPVYLSDYVK